jgi:hypothetical protein
MTDHDHAHEEEGQILGLAVGFRLFEDGGDLYLVEAEISPYQDDPTALGVTLVFHAMKGIDPTTEAGEEEPWVFDFDDELTRDESAPLVAQTDAILRQLAGLTPESLREYLHVAQEDADEE